VTRRLDEHAAGLRPVDIARLHTAEPNGGAHHSVLAPGTNGATVSVRPQAQARPRPGAADNREAGHAAHEEIHTMAVVTMRQLLESGVHFGHQTRAGTRR
jgi:hypothetical protein